MEKLQITQLRKAEPTSGPKLHLAVEPEHLTLSLCSGILNSITHQGWIDNVNGGGEAMGTVVNKRMSPSSAQRGSQCWVQPIPSLQDLLFFQVGNNTFMFGGLNKPRGQVRYGCIWLSTA